MAATEEGQPDSSRYLIVSSDAHAGPSLERSLRPYCPPEFLDEFDEFARSLRAGEFARKSEDELSHVDRGVIASLYSEDAAATLTDERRAVIQRVTDCAGHDDPHARLRDMDADGVAAELIFAGGQNPEVLPFVGFGADAGPAGVRPELRAAGERIWNRWLADTVSVAPQRLLGVLQVPIWDIDAAIQEVEWGHKVGLRIVNFPAPRADLVPYNDPAYEPFWSTCESLGVTLVTHTGGGESPLGVMGADGKYLPGGHLIYAYERFWLTRRHLWQMIFGGVFERHPDLKVVFTEQMVSWVGNTLGDLDNIHKSGTYGRGEREPKTPSEYWASNCYLSGSFLAPHEAALRNEVGVHNLLWGRDYPHMEGTWPHTKESLRFTFAGLPHDDIRLILGENAISAYHLDRQSLRPIADRIGPTPAEVDNPLALADVPPMHGRGFRTFENF